MKHLFFYLNRLPRKLRTCLNVVSLTARRLRLTTLVLLLFGIFYMPEAQAVINGAPFKNANTLLRSISWNPSEHRLEFEVLTKCDYGSLKNEWIDCAYVYIDNQNIFDIYGPESGESKGDDYHNMRIMGRHSTPNGIVEVRAQTTTSSDVYPPTSYKVDPWLFGTYPIASYPSTTHFTLNNKNEGNYYYAKFYWYPIAPITSDRNVWVKIGNNSSNEFTIMEEGGSRPTAKIPAVSKNALMVMAAAPTNQSITGGTIQTGGGLSITVNATGASNFILKKGSANQETKSGSGTASFTGRYITTKDEFLKGATFGFYMESKYAANKTTYGYTSTQTLTSQRTGVFSGNLAATLGTCGDVKLTWQIENPTITTGVNTSGFDLEVRKGTDNTWSGWTAITSGIPAYAHPSSGGGISSYEATYRIPTTDMNKGIVNYEFRVKRKFANWDDTDFGFKSSTLNSTNPNNSSSFLQQNRFISINTNYKVLDKNSLTIKQGLPASNFYPEIGWNFETLGIECTTNITLKLRVGVTETNIPSANITGSRTFQTTSSSMGILTCTPQRYELILQYTGQPAITYLVSADYVHESAGKREFTGIEASKGYYPDKINVKWFIKSGFDEFNRFRLLRKQLGQADNNYVTVGEFTHNAGVLQYNYDDANINAGIYYVYKVEGIYQCNTNSGSVPSPTATGFSQPFGSVSGRITFTGSQSVEGVSVNLTTTDNLRSNRELDFSRTRANSYVSFPAKANIFNREGYTFQAWIHPTLAGSDVTRYLISHHNCGIYVYGTHLAVGFPGYVNSLNNVITIGAYNHISVAIERTSTTDWKNYRLYVYINGELKLNAPFPPLTTDLQVSSGTIYLGCSNLNYFFDGYMDDIRIWNKVLTADEIKSNYDRVLSGKESGLVTYFRCDETDEISDAIFDCSAVGTQFNGNHAIKYSGVNRRDVDTKSTHLSLKGITDANGIYSITNSVPYTSEGTTYTIVPSLGVHKFDPTQRPLYFSPDSRVFNNVDFTDVSSFKVEGKVVYEGGTYPVAGCSFEIDDRLVLNPNGTPVLSNNNGEFAINVPIGIHSVRIVKNGHKFANDGYLKDEITGENLNYNAPIAGITFFDQTRVKLIGRVTGGKTENDKPLGFGESKNNIGVQTLTLESTRPQYEFASTTQIKTFAHNEGQWKKTNANGLNEVENTVTYNKEDIKIQINAVTGEFVAMLYPEPYYVGEIRVPGAGGAQNTIYNNRETIDLTNAVVFAIGNKSEKDMMKTSVRTWVDSVFVFNTPGVLDHWKYTEYSDTVLYNDKWAYFYQSTPTFSVQQISNGELVDYFGESEYIYEDDQTETTDTLKLYSKEGYLFGKPLFIQGNIYTFFLKAFEEYTSYATGTAVKVRYPVKDGTVYMRNNVSLISETESLKMDEDGEYIYEFMAGVPNLTTAKNDFFATLSLGSFGYYWNMGIEPYEVWHLGAKTTGTDFMTAGPDRVEIILRDPPGSKSKATISEGTTVTSTTSHTIGAGMTEALTAIVKVGPKTGSFLGIGAGIITEYKITISSSAGMTIKEEHNTKLENKQSTSFTEQIETSSDKKFVGSQGDVFVGYSTNILYGLTKIITIIKDYQDKGFTTKGAYSIAPDVSIAFGETFATRFVFSQMEIEELTIPKWKTALKSLLRPVGFVPTGRITVPVYVSKLATNDPNFGKLNTDAEAFGAEAASATSFDDGPSYKIYFPDRYDFKNFTDSVMYYNNQINGWTEILAQNEKEKVETEYTDNYSFGPGTSIKVNKSTSSTRSFTSTFSLALSASLNNQVGATINGIGLQVKSKHELKTTLKHTDGESVKTDVKTGFTLEDTDVTDEHTVDYGISESGTYVFKTRGGRTSCPYEGLEVTKYYEPGRYVLNEATMQVEVPKLRIVSAPEVLNVPSNKAATFVIAMENESETGAKGTFSLGFSDKTNPYGAELKIDGALLTDSRSFTVKAGETLIKTLTVEKGTVDKYNLELVLKSSCETKIADKKTIKVEFIPACSDVAIKEPRNNWILNADNPTGDTLNIIINDYNVNFPNFGYIRLEYRPVSSPVWSTIMTFYPSHLYANAQGFKENIGNRPEIVYPWKMPDADGAYEIRATAYSVNTANNVIIGNPLSYYSTEAVIGYKDVRRPAPLGAPSPTNGILRAGDELSIIFNEDIQTGMLTTNNFSISGVLNAQKIAEPNIGIAFEGKQSAKTELPIFANGSFSIETWFKRNPKSDGGTLFAFGANNNYISLGFDALGRAVLQVGEEIHTSTIAIADDETWKYIAMSYDRTANTVSVFEFEGITDNVLFSNIELKTVPEEQGQLIVGINGIGSEGFVGAIAHLHFYGVKRNQVEVTMDKSQTKSGREYGLIGYWQLNEAEGAVAKDKARSRNLMLDNADWYIYPSGRAVETKNACFAIQTATYPLNERCDFTLEFWFRSGDPNQINQTLFCADNGSIGLDANGSLLLYKKDGTVNQVLTTAKLSDTKWHHFAMSVRRNGNVNVYIDGASTAVFSESLLGTFASAHYYFGAKRTPPSTYSNYFAGYFDEIRIWNSALTRDGILLNKNSKLRGNEAGLQAYYPFETYIKQGNGLITVTESGENAAETDNNVISGTTSGISTTAASVTDVRPIETVPFTYVASNNKIVFTLDPNYFSRVESTILNISVKDVRDMRNNKSNTESWTAFVRRNALLWDSNPVSLQMQAGESKTFTAKIVNTGGTNVNYTIENLPAWLTVNNSTGSLQPLASKELTFTINQGVNIGSYETSIGLTSGNGVTEVLPLQLKVTGVRPDWSVNPANYESTMTITGRITIEDIAQEDESDILAAFIHDECVGLVSPIYIPEFNAYYTFLTIYGNFEHDGQNIRFKLWDASTGNIYPVIESYHGKDVQDFVFTANTIKGNMSYPVIHNALDIIEQSIDLKNGWNWISVNVTNERPSILQQFKERIGETGEILKGQSGYIQALSWAGSLTSIEKESMYIVKTNAASTIRFDGRAANPATSPITLRMGWNWIGYIPQFTLTVNAALAGLNAELDDMIKGHNGYRIYTGVNGWIGNLNYLRAGEGYMYASNAKPSKSFNYPSAASSQLKVAISTEEAVEKRWTVDVHKYPNTMTMTSIVLQGNVELQDGIIEIAAFAGSECRGSVLLQNVPVSEHKFIGFLMVFGEGGEKLTFKVYDHNTGNEYAALQQLNFATDAMLGTIEKPFTISFAATGMSDISVNALTLYPNPVADILNISYSASKIDLLSISDLTGRIILSEQDFAKKSINLQTLTEGVYFLNATINEETTVHKFIKK